VSTVQLRDVTGTFEYSTKMGYSGILDFQYSTPLVLSIRDTPSAGVKPTPSNSEVVPFRTNVFSKSPRRKVDVSCERKVVTMSATMAATYCNLELSLMDRMQNPVNS